LFDSDELVTA